jgi:hypothetical protein
MYPTARADISTGMRKKTRAIRLSRVSRSSSTASPNPNRFWKMATSTAYTTVMRSARHSVPFDARSSKFDRPTGLISALKPDQSVNA